MEQEQEKKRRARLLKEMCESLEKSVRVRPCCLLLPPP